MTVIDELRDYLANHLKQQNFQVSPGFPILFYKTEALYRDFVLVFTGVDEKKNTLGAMVDGGRRFELIESQWREFKSEVPKLRLDDWKDCTILADSHEIVGSGSRNATHLVLPIKPGVTIQMGDHLIEQWENRLKPSLDLWSDIVSLNNEINSTVENMNSRLNNNIPVWFHKLIIARLAGDSKFDEIHALITARLSAAIEQGNENASQYLILRTVIDRLYAKLQNVKPLENPSLIGETS